MGHLCSVSFFLMKLKSVKLTAEYFITSLSLHPLKNMQPILYRFCFRLRFFCKARVDFLCEMPVFTCQKVREVSDRRLSMMTMLMAVKRHLVAVNP